MSIWTACILIAFSSGSGWKGECPPVHLIYKCVPVCVCGRARVQACRLNAHIKIRYLRGSLVQIKLAVLLSLLKFLVILEMLCAYQSVHAYSHPHTCIHTYPYFLVYCLWEFSFASKERAAIVLNELHIPYLAQSPVDGRGGCSPFYVQSSLSNESLCTYVFMCFCKYLHRNP